jgi:hypothetical protein
MAEPKGGSGKHPSALCISPGLLNSHSSFKNVEESKFFRAFALLTATHTSSVFHQSPQNLCTTFRVTLSIHLLIPTARLLVTIGPGKHNGVCFLFTHKSGTSSTSSPPISASVRILPVSLFHPPSFGFIFRVVSSLGLSSPNFTNNVHILLSTTQQFLFSLGIGNPPIAHPSDCQFQPFPPDKCQQIAQ